MESLRIRWLTVVLLLGLSIFPLVQAKPKLTVDFKVAQQAATVYVTAWAQGALPPTVDFQISIWYNAVGTHGFVTIFSGTLLVQSANGYASALVHAAAPNGNQKNAHYFVEVQVYDPVTGNLLGKAGYDPRTGGTNGGAG